METELLHLDAAHPDLHEIDRAGRILREGGLVAFPTETVYGLGGNALDPEASMKIYAAKGRPSDNPLIVHIADMDHLYPIAAEVPEGAIRLADVWWPGPVTMIFRKKAIVPDETSGGLPTVAVRMPNHPIALALIRAAGGYIAAPSANTSGRPSPTRAEHVMEDLDGRIDMVIDGGEVRIGLESTIVDFTGDVPCILRPGYVNEQKLREILGEVTIDPAIIAPDGVSDQKPRAPGMAYRHYAPKARLSIVTGDKEAVIAKINELAGRDALLGKTVGIIATDETAMRYTGGHVRDIGSIESDKEIAQHLFSVLRDFDDDGVDIIYSEAFDTPRMGQAIMNRLLKAAGHSVIEA